jgi:hypothetical protein
MVSDAIRKRVDEIQGQWTKRLQELTILVLSLQVIFFIDYWFGDWWQTRPLLLGLPNANWIYLDYDITMLVVSVAFLIGIVFYFWRLENKPQFHVLFMERRKVRKIETKHFFMLLLLPVGISVGLSLSPLYYGFGLEGPLSLSPSSGFGVVGPSYWWSPQNYDKLLPFYPLIVVLCTSVLFYLLYRIKPERVQRTLPWLLFIPILLSSFALLFQMCYNSIDWYASVSTTAADPPGSVGFAANAAFVSYYTLFLASFIVLFYLTYRINAGYKKSRTLIKEKHLRGLVDEGIVILPTEVREGESHSISLDLKLSKGFVKRALDIDDHYKSNDYLEAELQAPGLNVDGEKRLRIFETSSLPVASWTCYFPTSGVQTITLMIRVVKSDNSRHVIFMQSRNVKVNSLMNISWVPICILTAPFLAAAVQVLLKLR